MPHCRHRQGSWCHHPGAGPNIRTARARRPMRPHMLQAALSQTDRPTAGSRTERTFSVIFSAHGSRILYRWGTSQGAPSVWTTLCRLSLMSEAASGGPHCVHCCPLESGWFMRGGRRLLVYFWFVFVYCGCASVTRVLADRGLMLGWGVSRSSCCSLALCVLLWTPCCRGLVPGWGVRGICWSYSVGRRHSTGTLGTVG